MFKLKDIILNLTVISIISSSLYAIDLQFHNESSNKVQARGSWALTGYSNYRTLEPGQNSDIIKGGIDCLNHIEAKIISGPAEKYWPSIDLTKHNTEWATYTEGKPKINCFEGVLHVLIKDREKYNPKTKKYSVVNITLAPLYIE